MYTQLGDNYAYKVDYNCQKYGNRVMCGHIFVTYREMWLECKSSIQRCH